MKYELTLLLLEEAEAKTIKDSINSIKAKIEKDDSWGKKTLAYPIEKNRSAYYLHWLLEIDERRVNELKKKLDFNEKLLRYLLLKVNS